MSGERLLCWLPSERNSLNISSASSLKIQRREERNQILTALSCTLLSISRPPPSRNIILSPIFAIPVTFLHSINLSLSVSLSLPSCLTHMSSAGLLVMQERSPWRQLLSNWLLLEYGLSSRQRNVTMLDGVCVCNGET